MPMRDGSGPWGNGRQGRGLGPCGGGLGGRGGAGRGGARGAGFGFIGGGRWAAGPVAGGAESAQLSDLARQVDQLQSEIKALRQSPSSAPAKIED
ncbi:MAG: DUF5320 family protein [Pseudomonadota bacterium]